MVSSVIKRSIRYQATLLTRQINTQFIAKSHAHHIVTPTIHGFLYVAIFASIAQHIIESPAEITVARRADGLNEVQR